MLSPGRSLRVRPDLTHASQKMGHTAKESTLLTMQTTRTRMLGLNRKMTVSRTTVYSFASSWLEKPASCIMEIATSDSHLLKTGKRAKSIDMIRS